MQTFQNELAMNRNINGIITIFGLILNKKLIIKITLTLY